MPLQVGIVGTGENARDHGRACSRLAETELVAICDVSPAALERYGDEFDVGSRYASLDEMLTSQDLDILIVSTWGIHHASISNRAAQSGRVRAILVEKPISMDASECQGMIDAAHARGVLLMEGFKWRHDPQHHRVKEIIDSGRLGRIRSVHGAFSSPIVRLAAMGNWRFDPARGGGSVFDTASYLIHFARFVVGEEPIRVYSTGAALTESRVELSTAIVLEFSDGATALLTASYEQAYCQTVQVVGTRGWIRMDSPFDTRSLRDQEYVDKEPLAATFEVSYNNFDLETYSFAPVNQFELQLAHLCDCLAGTSTPRIPPEFSLANMRVIDAVYASLRARSPIAVQADG